MGRETMLLTIAISFSFLISVRTELTEICIPEQPWPVQIVVDKISTAYQRQLNILSGWIITGANNGTDNGLANGADNLDNDADPKAWIKDVLQDIETEIGAAFDKEVTENEAANGENKLDKSLNIQDIEPEKNKVLTILPYMGQEFSVCFDIFINSYPAADVPFVSVLHFSRGQNAAMMGDRLPGVWVTPAKELHITSAISNNLNNWKNHGDLKDKDWNKVCISQKLVEQKYMFEVEINDQVVRLEENTSPQAYENVKVFYTDAWYPAFDGKLRNLRIATEKKIADGQ